jgi:hypothetical protein
MWRLIKNGRMGLAFWLARMADRRRAADDGPSWVWEDLDDEAECELHEAMGWDVTKWHGHTVLEPA